ncbi:glycosyltransferase family 2 protein [Paraflavitalea devenefica]|uniref:glycosyltransferase family 2 protein n=1 Tax=Paraflavitalea devenefica TaxID=2716334 RepID=UPI001FE33871|nr:glycosyltransferase family 2 protein [Paraflavitalea devenefica]
MLSVVIVNYNVKYFLEQCLCSVKKAMESSGTHAGPDFQAQAEVLVVDNHSSDGSIDYLQSRFPFVRFIANTENTGFARANNQALQQCRGKYILFLNPDTILPEDAFGLCFSFMEAHPDAGALGVRMIDGSGRYLPESKRGFPAPWVSFCKMSGLTKLFPHSKLLARYYLGHLSPAATHPVDVLSGAFMWVRKAVLDKTGGFDERFFMYAEDIDLSYRIQQSGYHNYYLPTPTIIHFKGESTRRDVRYVRLFYTAMIQFVQKHFTGPGAWFYVALLRSFIYLKSIGTESRKEMKGKATSLPTSYITGNVENVVHIIKKIGNKRIIEGGPDSADELIYAEGLQYSFKDIIAAMQNNPAQKKIRIHAAGSNSIVGSDSKNILGEIIILDN